MRSDCPSPLAAIPAPRPDRDTFLPLLRWLILGAALGLCILALSRADRVGAAAPANCIPINQTSCLSNGVIYTNGTPTANIGLPGSTVIPGYAVPFVGYPTYGYGAYISPNVLPYYGGYYGNLYSGYYGYLGTNCDPKAWWCLNYEYTGDVFSNLFVPGPGGIAVINTAAPAPSGAVPTGTIYRPREVAQPATTTAAAPVAAPQATPAPTPTTQMVTALNAPAQAEVSDSTSVKILGAQTTTTPVSSDLGRDDGK